MVRGDKRTGGLHQSTTNSKVPVGGKARQGKKREETFRKVTVVSKILLWDGGPECKGRS